MRSFANSLAIWLSFAAFAQSPHVTVHARTSIVPELSTSAGTASNQSCCECSKPPGGKTCCDSRDFVGCVVKNGQCECTCFSANMKREPDDVARDILAAMIGPKAGLIQTQSISGVLNKVISATEQGKSHELHYEDGTRLFLTLSVPKESKDDLKWFREHIGSTHPGPPGPPTPPSPAHPESVVPIPDHPRVSKN